MICGREENDNQQLSRYYLDLRESSGRPREERSVLKTIRAIVLAAVVFYVTPAFTADQAPPPPGPPGENAQAYTDPLSPFNERMFWFNLTLAQYPIHPPPTQHAKLLPTPPPQP